MLAEESGAEVVASSYFRTLLDPKEEAGEPQLDLAGRERRGRRGRHRPLRAPDAVGRRQRQAQGRRARELPGPPPRDVRRGSACRARPCTSTTPTTSPSAPASGSGVYTPGHTNDHLCLFDPEGGTLLSGDHVLPTITPHISGLIEGDPLRAYLDSLDKVAAFPGVTTVLPAHGHPFTDLAGRVEAIKLHHAERLELLRAASQERGWSTVTELMQELFRERSWGHMAESETFAHLEHLRLLGEAERREEGGYLLYRVA